MYNSTMNTLLNNKPAMLALGLGAVILLAGGYYIYTIYTAPAPIQTSPTAENQPVAVVNEGSSVSDKPLEKQPELNPVSKTNPFKEVKTNPFE